MIYNLLRFLIKLVQIFLNFLLYCVDSASSEIGPHKKHPNQLFLILHFCSYCYLPYIFLTNF